MKTFLAAATILVSLLHPGRAQDNEPAFRFSRIISDGMVLQQEKPIKIWGWAKPGAEVSVTLTRPTAFLSLIGITQVTVTGHASVTLVHAVTGDQP